MFSRNQSIKDPEIAHTVQKDFAHCLPFFLFVPVLKNLEVSN